jgi:outer membrane protein assembly factor BamE (lipoprotein component of BamABCDE complex)
VNEVQTDTAFLLVAAWSLSACSVGMALSGKDNPDLGAVKVGSTRGEVEMHLGSPVTSSFEENGNRVDIYE